MLDYLDTDRCRMRFLRDQLDDPEAEPTAAAATTAAGSPCRPRCPTTAVEEADARLARPGVVVEPRKMWPTALANLGIDLKGKIAEGAEAGRAVARLTDLGYGQALRELFREGTPDGPVPDAAGARGHRGARATGGPRSTAHRRRRVRDPAHADRRLRRRALPLPAGARSSAAARSPTRGSPRDRAPPTPPSGSPRSAAATGWRPTSPPGPVLLVDDLVAPAGPSPSRPARCARRARLPCCPWCSPSGARRGRGPPACGRCRPRRTRRRARRRAGR